MKTSIWFLIIAIVSRRWIDVESTLMQRRGELQSDGELKSGNHNAEKITRRIPEVEQSNHICGQDLLQHAANSGSVLGQWNSGCPT